MLTLAPTCSCFPKLIQLYKRVLKGLPHVLTHQSANHSHPMAAARFLLSCAGPPPITLSQESGTKGRSPPLDRLCGEEREESRAIPNVLTVATARCVSRVHITPRACLSLAGLHNKGRDLLQHTGVQKLSNGKLKIKAYSQGQNLD